MGETSKIAAMANKVSEEIFSIFGWKLEGPQDQSWPCVTESHGKNDHPTDSVFSYEDPYANRTVYLNTDLKSYARGSITKASISGALKTLALAVDCADKSPEWGKLYANKDYPHVVEGLLFVYNHDGEYDEDFTSLRGQIDDSGLALARGVKMTVLGPREVAYLATVANDIERLRGRQIVPFKGVSFYYPDLITVRPKSNRHSAATVEVLTGPWQVLHFARALSAAVEDCYVVYYAGAGDSPEEFKYLIDFFFRYQLLQENSRIFLRLPFAHSEARVFFAKALDQFVSSFYDMKELRQRLERIEFEAVTNVIKSFSQTDLGMTRG